MKKLWIAFLEWLLAPVAIKMVGDKLDAIKGIECELDTALKTLRQTYTTVKAFNGMNAEYYGWICRLIETDEWKFFVFDIKENAVRDMIQLKDEKDLLKSIGRLEMINIICNYFTTYKSQYEIKIQRSA